MKTIMDILPATITKSINDSGISLDCITEIRLCRDKPVIVYTPLENFLLDSEDKILTVSKTDIDEVISRATNYSLYLKENEIHNGYLSLQGGFRMGICGTVAYKDNKIVSHFDFSSVNIRKPREIIGCANKIIGAIQDTRGVKNTLIISPPGKGKTTVLRDLARQLSDKYCMKVGIVDEREELWGNGSFDVGIRTDVLNNCKKGDGIMMLIRTMNPDVIIVDEIGSSSDLSAIEYAGTCGVIIIASIHGNSMEDVKRKGCDVFDSYFFIEEFNKIKCQKGEIL